MSGGKPPHPRLFTGGYAPLRQEKPCITPAATCCALYHLPRPQTQRPPMPTASTMAERTQTGSESNPRPCWRQGNQGATAMSHRNAPAGLDASGWIGSTHMNAGLCLFIQMAYFPEIHMPNIVATHPILKFWFFPCLNITKKQA